MYFIIDNHINALRKRKAENDAYSADVVADFSFVFRMQEDSEVEQSLTVFVCKLFTKLLKEKVKAQIKGIIIIVGLGYGRDSFIGIINDIGTCAVLVFPDHILEFHPSNALCQFSPFRKG